LRVAHGHEFDAPANALERRLAVWLKPRRDVRHLQLSQAAFPSLRGRSAVMLYGDALGVTISDPALDMPLTHDEEQAAAADMRQYVNPVVLQIRAKTSDNKHWPVERWEALVARNPHVTFLHVGLADEPRLERSIDLRGHPIRQTFALIKHAKCLVGIDSVMAHAAVAVGTPAIVLFGPTGPEVWGHASTVALTRRLRCAPCLDTLLDGACPYNVACLTGIHVDEVEAALRAYVGDPPATSADAGEQAAGQQVAGDLAAVAAATMS
jgi:hypothetical protein